MFAPIFRLNRIPRLMINTIRQIEWRSEKVTCWGLSALAHAVVLGLLVFVTLSPAHPPEFVIVSPELAVPEPVVTIDPPSRLPQSGAPLSLSAGGLPGAPGPIAAGLETAPEQVSRRVAFPSSAGQPPSPLDFEPRLPPNADLAVSTLGRKLGKGLALGGGFGSGVGDGEGNGSGSQFFELSTAGTRFVYVIDGSGSMTEPHKEARSKLERVKIELIRSIGGLPFEMEFFVIFFNNHAVPMKARTLQPATGDNKQKYLEWVAKVQGGGNTDPRDALKLALDLKPDIIYLLTDGVFDPKVASEVTKLNTQKVSIHTFCFGNASGESLLQDIARKNNGTYKFIP
jgi:hypothetical protein